MHDSTKSADRVDAIRWDRVAAAAAAEAGAWSPRPRTLPTPDDLTPIEALLAHYATRPATHYTQIDIDHMPGGDGLFPSDQDGDLLFSTTSTELWTGNFAVRVHIKHGTDPVTAARQVRKAAECIENGGLAVEATVRREEELRDLARYIADNLSTEPTGSGITVIYPDNKRPPRDTDGIAADLAAGNCWLSWMDDHVLATLAKLGMRPA